MHSYITKYLQKRFGRLLTDQLRTVCALEKEKRLFMHDFLIALVFVAMVAAPAIVAASPKIAKSEDH